MAEPRLSIGITCYPSYGGSGVVATELGMALAERGHRIHFICYDVPFRLDRCGDNIRFHEVEVPTYPLFQYPPYLLALANKMAEVARYEGLDVLHVHYAIPHATSAFLAREMLAPLGPKVVTTLHGTDITLVGQQPSFADIIAFSINRSDAVTAVSEALRRETLARFTVYREVVTIPNFVDLNAFRPGRDPELRRRYARDDEALLVHVSNFRPTKRVDRVVDVFSRVAQRLPARLLMVGDGPDLGVARALAAELGVADRVQFVGKVERVAPLMAAADLCLLPSTHESFGLVALEAMACGVPVIASRVGGLPEVVVDGECGYLLPEDDVEGMARRAAELLGNPALYRGFAAAGRRRAGEFAAERIIPRYEALYADVLGRGARPPAGGPPGPAAR